VTAPPAAKEWKRGYTYPIKWTGGKPSANVKIQLLRNKPDGTVVFKTLTIATPNDGVFKWKVPSKQALDDDYRVRVIYLPDTTIRDVSETFKIVTGPVVYEVWGGSTDYFSEPQWWEYYENIDQQDYVKLGESYGESATFHGNYKYYVIAARRAFLLDCVQGSNDQYPNDFYLGGNLENEENIRHAPDGQYATIGAFDGGGTFRGFIVFQNYNRNWTSIKVYTDR
jgi:hypothetical protein